MFRVVKAVNFNTCRGTISFQLNKNNPGLPLNSCIVRLYCDTRHSSSNSNNNTNSKNSGISSDNRIESGLDLKYTIFQESDAPVLLDVYEEKLQLESQPLPTVDQDFDKFYGLNLERGLRGVYDIEDLIELLRRDKAEDIFVASLPPEAKYVDYIVVVNGRSRKHMTALAEIIRRVFKKKRVSTDILPRIEGENSSDWMALDLGNIALHIFSRNARRVYDLESLWSVGAEFDPLLNEPDDPLITLLKKHSISLNTISKGE